jgi:hypothetical protein
MQAGAARAGQLPDVRLNLGGSELPTHEVGTLLRLALGEPHELGTEEGAERRAEVRRVGDRVGIDRGHRQARDHVRRFLMFT